MVVEVDDELAMLEPARPFRGGRGSPAEGSLHAGEELREAQRLRDVVVGAELQAADLVGLGAPRGDEEDRHPAELADPLDDLPAVEAGQGDVEDHEVRMVVVEPPQRVVAARGDDRPVAGVAHPELEERGELRLVLDDRGSAQPRRCSRTRRASRSRAGTAG